MICNGPGGPFGLFLSPSFLVWFSCPQVVERDPSYPPLADSPSLPTPSRIGRMASRQEGGGRDFFPAFGKPTRSPFSRRGLAFVLCLFCLLCVFCVFDNLRALLDGFVCLFVLLCLSFVCSSARPWFLIRELVVRWLVFLSLCVLRPACATSCCVCPFVLVALRCVVLVLFCCSRCSVELFLSVVGVRGGFCFSFAFCLVINVCVPQGGRSAACTRSNSSVSAVLSVGPACFF